MESLGLTFIAFTKCGMKYRNRYVEKLRGVATDLTSSPPSINQFIPFPHYNIEPHPQHLEPKH